MTLIELLVFLILCAGLSFLGYLVSPHWGWLPGAVMAGVVLVTLIIGPIVLSLKKNGTR